MSDLSKNTYLADGLLPYVDEERLDANFRIAYDQLPHYLHDSVTDDQIAAAREVVLDVPLVHATKHPDDIASMLQHGIEPFACRPDDVRHGNTEILDESLGLDEYAFMFFGKFTKDRYGSQRVLVDSRLLLQDRTIVTDADITTYVRQDHHLPFEAHPEDVKLRVETQYFNNMYRGEDWVTIKTLAALHSAIVTKGDPFTMIDLHAAEVKYHGVVPSDTLLRAIPPENAAEQDEKMLAKGAMSAKVYSGLYSGSYYFERASPESVAAGRQIWRNILDIDPDTPPYIYDGGYSL